ncbi:MAG: response regulator [Verrucomicrobia bacterium]|nr:response regulator [Verrucomicrobiota bacterium]
MKLPRLVELTPKMQRAQIEYERPLIIQNYRIACILGIVFMPFGGLLDYFIYPEFLEFFFWLRIECSILLTIIWWVLGQPFGKKYFRPLGLIEVTLPIFFISWMIYETDGIRSDYYAGINIVLVGIGFLMRWGLADTTRMVFISILLYLTACLFGPSPIEGEEGRKDLVNSIYFITLTGIFSMTGNYLYNLNRTREFALRWELDENRRQLEAGNRKLKELDRVKNRFFANISHELRTPLTLLLTPLESLILKGQYSLPPDIKDTLSSMQANGMRLLKLINDLLDLVRLESGQMNVTIKNLHLESFIKGIVSSIRKTAEDRSIQIEADIHESELSLHTDREKLEKIILNLVFNALKFTSPGGMIRISARSENENVIIQITDTGIGIPQESLAFIFDRFWQVDSSSKRKHQGAGIGLALVKEFVEVLGGRVDVESQEDKGTTFTIKMPARFSMEASVAADESIPVKITTESSGHQRESEGRRSQSSSEALKTGSATSEISSNREAKEEDGKEWLAKLYRRAELFPATSLEPIKIRSVTDLPRRQKNQPLLLIADDEPDMLTFLRAQLEGHYEILEAQDGQEAVQKAKQFLPDIILTDMMMPEKDGLQICQELQATTSTENIPIVLLTARVDEDIKLSALKAGASDFLTKPFSLAEIHVRLKNLSDTHLYQRTLKRQKKKLESTLDELKDTETMLVQSEKMASLGKMSAGILHEINNPLNFAKTGAYTLREFAHQLPEDERDEYQDIIKDVEEGITRVSDIVQDLRGFSHPDSEHKFDTSLERVVTKSLKLLSNEVKHVHLENDVSSDLTIHGNENQLIQVLVNILQNASDSLDSKTYDENAEGPCIKIRGFRKEDRIHLLIRDNGTGIEDQHMARIFDPFYTTKDVGSGMGLGLSICYKIMEHHQATIKVNTKSHLYTEFDLDFPDLNCMVDSTNDIESTL